MKKYTIAQILNYAADKYLAVKESDYWIKGGNKEKYSCCAVEEAVSRLYTSFEMDYHQKQELVGRIKTGLSNMGCPTESNAFDDDGKFIPEVQQTRYAWLKFAAIMAKEQGV
jgi:hypothetical protein